jgi:hypothetical protein
MAALNSFTLSKKYTTNEIQKCKGYAFKDFILDCVRKMTEPEGREDENDSTGCITSLYVNSTDMQTTADEGSS